MARETRKVVRKLRMPAAAKRGGYEVPEEITVEEEELLPVQYKERPYKKTPTIFKQMQDKYGPMKPPGMSESDWEEMLYNKEEVYPGAEQDPITGEEYTPKGVEPSVDPTDITDPIQVKKKGGPFIMGMLRRMKGKTINPKNLPVESTVRTPLAVVNKEFAKKAMSPDEEGARRLASDYLEKIGYPKEKRAEAIEAYVKTNVSKNKDFAGTTRTSSLPIENSEAREVASSRAYVNKLQPRGSPEHTATHEGTHRLLNPVGSISYNKVSTQEKILNEEIPDNVKTGLNALLKAYGYAPEQIPQEYVAWLPSILNKQVPGHSLPSNPTILNLARQIPKETVKETHQRLRQSHPYKKILMKELNWNEKDYNQFIKDAKKAYNNVLNRAENLTPEELAKAEKETLKKAKYHKTYNSTKKTTKPTDAIPSETAAMKELTPDVDEDLGLTMERLKQVTPGLGEEKGRSVLQKITDPFLEFLEDRKNKKWSEQYSKDRRAHIQQQLEDRKRRRFMQAEQRRKSIEEAGTPIEGGTKPPTEIE